MKVKTHCRLCVKRRFSQLHKIPEGFIHMPYNRTGAFQDNLKTRSAHRGSNLTFAPASHEPSQEVFTTNRYLSHLPRSKHEPSVKREEPPKKKPKQVKSDKMLKFSSAAGDNDPPIGANVELSSGPREVFVKPSRLVLPGPSEPGDSNFCDSLQTEHKPIGKSELQAARKEPAFKTQENVLMEQDRPSQQEGSSIFKNQGFPEVLE